MPSEASGTAICSFGAESFSAPDSAIAEGAVADSFVIDDNCLPLPSPPTAAIGSPACCRALGDSKIGSTSIPSTPGLAFGCSSV